MVLLPGVARAQETRMPLIGFLGSETFHDWTDRLAAFRQGLNEAGFAEGRNLQIIYRWAEGDNERLPALAAELVQQRVSVLVALGGTASALAAKGATARIPIVFHMATNPVENGLVASFNRPGGNVTGVTTMGADLGSKQLEILCEMVPVTTVMGLLINPGNLSIARLQIIDVPAAAVKLGIRLHMVNVTTESDFEPAFSSLRKLDVGGLVLGADTYLNSKSEQLAHLAFRYSMPTISPYRGFAKAGGLMSYGADIVAASRQAAVYVGRILKGELPGDLPIEQPTLFQLVINVKAAKSLGLSVPTTLLTRADEVIE